MKRFLDYVNKLDLVLLILIVLSLVFSWFESLGWTLGQVGDYLILSVAVIGTFPVFYSAYKAVINRKISVDLLASVALIFSLLTNEWLSVIFINLMLTSARIFMSYNEARARKSIDALFKLKPVKIKVQRGETIKEIDPKEVQTGDLVIVDLGERVPVDGEIVSGGADLDESSLTGESVPVTKVIGNKVFSSTLVVSGSLTIKTEKVGAETTLEKIIKLVEQAQLEKPDIHTTAEKFAGWYLTTIFVGAIILYFFTLDLKMVLSVLLVVCADDVAVAVPLTFLTAISFCAKRGIIVKGASYLEAMSQVKTIFVDKTGTLTKGKILTERFECLKPEFCSRVLRFSGLISGLSNHPVSKSIVAYVEKENGQIVGVADKFQEIAGKGLIAQFGTDKVLLGKLKFIEEFGATLSDELRQKIYQEEEKGYNITIFELNGQVEGYFILADELRPGIKEVISELKHLGIEKIIMLTGDNERVASRIAKEVGLTGFYSNLLPEQKLDYIRGALNKEHKVAMVGDGVNDAASLSLADIGIAMGNVGLDAAIEAADIILVKDNFGKIPQLIRVAKEVVKISNQDFVIWGLSNVVGLFLVFVGYIGPTGAAAYNFLTDFLPLINSTRVFRLYLKEKE
jgi:heavy metal translocating P-type ATPase